MRLIAFPQWDKLTSLLHDMARQSAADYAQRNIVRIIPKNGIAHLANYAANLLAVEGGTTSILSNFSGTAPSSARRPFGISPPYGKPSSSAASIAPRSTPVCPPDMILLICFIYFSVPIVLPRAGVAIGLA